VSNIPDDPNPRDPRRPLEPASSEETPVEERDVSPPAARSTRGVRPGAARILFLIVGVIIVIYLCVVITGVVELG
jgi:hypothetical protein